MRNRTDKPEAVVEMEKETRNTLRYAEALGGQAPIAKTAYLQKWALLRLRARIFPERIRVSVEEARK